MVRTSTVAQYAACMGDLPSTLVVAEHYFPPQSPEPDSLSEAESTSTKSAHFEKDFRPSLPVKGMYPLLDLITEQGSSGLGKPQSFSCRLPSAHNIHSVDKIVIAQESLQEFINELSPGAYSSITKVNFKILDNLFLKPFGIYGSKEEIVRFLCEIKAVDDDMWVFLFCLASGWVNVWR